MANKTKPQGPKPKNKVAPHELPGVTITASKKPRIQESEQKDISMTYNGRGAGMVTGTYKEAKGKVKPATYKKGESVTSNYKGVTARKTAIEDTKKSRTSNSDLYRTPFRVETVSFDNKKKR